MGATQCEHQEENLTWATMSSVSILRRASLSHLTRSCTRTTRFVRTYATSEDNEKKEKPVESEQGKNMESDTFEEHHGERRNVSSDSEASVKAEKEAPDSIDELQKSTEEAAKGSH